LTNEIDTELIEGEETDDKHCKEHEKEGAKQETRLPGQDTGCPEICEHLGIQAESGRLGTSYKFSVKK
jgi:hypothetical protein